MTLTCIHMFDWIEYLICKRSDRELYAEEQNEKSWSYSNDPITYIHSEVGEVYVYPFSE